MADLAVTAKTELKTNILNDVKDEEYSMRVNKDKSIVLRVSKQMGPVKTLVGGGTEQFRNFKYSGNLVCVCDACIFLTLSY